VFDSWGHFMTKHVKIQNDSFVKVDLALLNSTILTEWQVNAIRRSSTDDYLDRVVVGRLNDDEEFNILKFRIMFR